MAAGCGTRHIVATPHVIELNNCPSWERINEGVAQLKTMVAEEKLDLAIYPGAEIENFYTDSENDRAMMDISKNVYLVKGQNITKIK